MSVVAPGGSISFLISSSVLKPQSVKSDWCRKSRKTLELFDPPVKFRGGVGKMSEWILRAQPMIKLTVYFWQGVSQLSERLERCWEKEIDRCKTYKSVGLASGGLRKESIDKSNRE